MKRRLPDQKTFIITWYLLVMTSLVYGQAEWTWQNPLPGSTTFWTSEVFDANTVYVFGDNGEWLKSTDGGQHWEIRNNGTRERFLGSSFVSEQTGWIVSLQGTVLKTTDGGASWQNLSTGLIAPQFSAVVFTDEQTGWIAGLADGFPVIVRTDDGGASWTEQAHASFSEGGFSTLHFLDASTGFVAGHNNELFKTTDGGATWILKTTPDPSLNFREFADIDFTDALTGYAQRDDTLFVTTDGGETWQQTAGQPRPDRWTYLTSIDFSDAMHGYVSDNYGGIHFTSDGGATWTKSYQEPGWNTILDINMLNAQYGFAAGIGVIVHTDNGIGWQSQVKGTQAALRSIRFADKATGWTAGDDGTILYTENGGATWVEQQSNTDQRLLDIAVADAGHVWIAGRNGIILRTENGGKDWVTQHTGTGKHMNAIHFVNTSQGWAAGDTLDHILHTTDGGTTWTYQYTGIAESLKGLCFVSPAQGWAVGTNGTILHSSDGMSWSVQTSGTGRNLNSVFFINAEKGWAAGDSATILYTTDGGITWAPQTSPVSFLYPDLNDGSIDLYEVQFLNEKQGYIMGRYGYLLTTQDGGETWDYAIVPFAYSLSFQDINTGWISGAGGAILHYSDNKVLALDNAYAATGMPVISAYPNPAGEHVQIEFTAHAGTETVIDIVRLSGEKIASFNIFAHTGVNTFHWHIPSAVPNGMYVCIVRSQDNEGYHKLVISR